MKATGIVRRIDELGRVVIPKEIRKNLRINEGENIEIFVDGENIILKKFSVIKKLGDLAQNFTDAIYYFLKHNIIITDTDSVIASSGKYKKECLNREISDSLITSIQRREKMLETHNKNLIITKDFGLECTYVINSVFAHGDVVGLVIIFSDDDKVSEQDQKIADITTTFLTKYLEE